MLLQSSGPPPWANGNPNPFDLGPCGGICIPIDQGVFELIVIGLIVGFYLLYKDSKKHL